MKQTLAKVLILDGLGFIVSVSERLIAFSNHGLFFFQQPCLRDLQLALILAPPTLVWVSSSMEKWK